MRGLHTLRAAHPADPVRSDAVRIARGVAVAVFLALPGAPPFAHGEPARAIASDSADPAYAAELIALAHAQQLAESPQWRRLLHWNEPTLRPGGESFVDDPRFFLATDGRTDPAAELDATLNAFFAPASETAPPPPPRAGEAPLAQHPQCALIARRAYLDEALGFDHTRLPLRPCPAYDAFRTALGARGATLVFPEAFLGNPASMFGHTFLRIDRLDRAGAAEPDLLGFAVNFSGATGEGDPGALFAVKGLIGAYPGSFDVEPYWQRVRAYGDLERRDLWEYRLRLDASALDQMLAHLWELQGVRFDYFYFDENCSLRLLELLAVALRDTPAADTLTDGLPPWVIPVDAVRAVAQAGLIDEVHWRAAPATHLRRAARTLPHALRETARALAGGTLAPGDAALEALTPHDRAAVLHVAYELLHHGLLAGEVERDAMATRARALLVARSRIVREAEGNDTRLVAVEPRVSPEAGHRAARAGLATGISHDGAFIEARLRPAFHDLLDPAGGYTTGAEVRMLDAAVRWHPGRERVRLDSLTLVGLVSEPAWDELLRPIAWHVDVGTASRWLHDGGRPESALRERWVARAAGGVGLSLALGPRGSLVGSIDATAEASPHLRHSAALGPGASVGLRLRDASDLFALHGYATLRAPLLGDDTLAWRAGVEQRLALGANRALVLDVARDGAYGRSEWVGRLGLDVYF